MIRAGELVHRITIQQATEGQSATSGALTTDPWTTFAQRSASIETSGGREFASARATHGELTHLIRMRGRCALTPKMQVLLSDGRVFEILAAWSPDGRACAKADEIHLACREIL